MEQSYLDISALNSTPREAMRDMVPEVVRNSAKGFTI